MCGFVMATIWPKYEGSVSTSWYPQSEVLKQTSPVTVRAAPKASPRNTLPSSKASSAVMSAGD